VWEFATNYSGITFQFKFQITSISDVLIEPTDTSFKQAIQFANSASPSFDAFVAVGGGKNSQIPI
jgi:alcohol dehydrogenase class IV